MHETTPSPITPNFNDPRHVAQHHSILSQWWSDIVRNQDNYRCFAFLLLRQTDEAAIQCLIGHGSELDLLFGSDCVVFLQVEALVTGNPFSTLRFIPDLIEEVREGYSLETGRYFEIELDAFPCLVLFRDLISIEHLVVSLRDMDMQEIAVRLRTLFTTIRRGIDHKKNWLEVIESQRNTSKFRFAGRTIVREIQGTESKTFQSAVESVFKETLASSKA